MTEPRVHIGPELDPAIEDAVRRGGGQPADPESADAVVWLGGPDALHAVLGPRVRWVQLPSAGIEAWLASGVIDSDRTWTSAAGVYADSVAEHALALILAGRRRLHECARADRWRPELHGRPLAGATVTIVGAGGIGESLIRMLEPLGVEVVAVTRSGRAVAGAEAVPADRLADVWPRSDVVVLAAPATDATRHMIGEAELRALPDHAWLVNVGRGSLVDHDALVRALRGGWIAGAALDVTEPEPLPDDHPLWRLPNALITPHAANPPQALRAALAGRVAENVARFAAGRELIGAIDADRGY
jgi:phosphoglycerate dehydrogenase-like enzyme